MTALPIRTNSAQEAPNFWGTNMNENIAIGLMAIVFGALLILAAFVISVNTSLGGTRSDYDDGSDFWGGLGVFVLLFGVAAVAVGGLS